MVAPNGKEEAYVLSETSTASVMLNHHATPFRLPKTAKSPSAQPTRRAHLSSVYLRNTTGLEPVRLVRTPLPPIPERPINTTPSSREPRHRNIPMQTLLSLVQDR